MTSSNLNFSNHHLLVKSISIYIVNENTMKIIVRNSICLQSLFSNESTRNVTIRNVLYVSKLAIDLFSISQIAQIDCSIFFDDIECTIIEKNVNDFVLHFFFVRDQYSLNFIRTIVQIIAFAITFNKKYNDKTFKFWNRRIDHVNMNDFKRLKSMIIDMNFAHAYKKSSSRCFSCMKNKMKIKFSRRFQNSVFEKNEIMNSNLDDFISFMIFRNFNHFAFITCRIIDYIWVYLLRNKNDFFDVIENHFLSFFKIQKSTKFIKRWKFDEKNEIQNAKMKIFFAKHDIEWKFSIVYCFEQNDVAKIQNRTIIIKIKCFFDDVDLFDNFWNEILIIEMYLKNRCFISRLKIQHMILYEIWHEIKSNINHYRLIDCNV